MHALSCRSPERTIFRQGQLPRSPKLELALGGSLAAQLLANLLPGLRRLLELTPMGTADIAVVAIGSVLPLLVNEAITRRAIAPAEREPARRKRRKKGKRWYER